MDYVLEVAMMSDLISRSWMMEQLDGLGDTRLIKRNFIALVTNAPTVDAVEVVRCRDCKHRGTDYCIFHINGEPADEELLRKLDNDFCSYGERKDDGSDG